MKKEQQDNIWGPAKFNREMKSLGELTSSFGLPRMIITGFLVLLFLLAPVAGVDFFTQITNVLNRFSWNAVMVLAMVPMIHSGCGLNFGLPLGLVSGLLGATLSIQFGFTGAMSFVMATAPARMAAPPRKPRRFPVDIGTLPSSSSWKRGEAHFPMRRISLRSMPCPTASDGAATLRSAQGIFRGVHAAAKYGFNLIRGLRAANSVRL